MKTLLQLAAIAALCLPACAQTWFSPSPQIVDGTTITFISTATVRYGQNASICAATYLTCVMGQPSPAAWLPPVTITATTLKPVTITIGTVWAGSDPNPGVRKQLQFMQAATSQPMVVASNGVKIPMIVPALPPTAVAKWNCDLNQMSDGTFSSIAGSCVKK